MLGIIGVSLIYNALLTEEELTRRKLIREKLIYERRKRLQDKEQEELDLLYKEIEDSLKDYYDDDRNR